MNKENNSAFTIKEIQSLSIEEAVYLTDENFLIWLKANLDKYKDFKKLLKKEAK